MIQLIPMTQSEFDSFLESIILEHAANTVRAGNSTEAKSLERSRETHADLLPQGLATPNNYLFSVKDPQSDERVGWLWLTVEGENAFINYIAINEEHRRKGYGTQVMDAAEAEAAQVGCYNISLHVFGFNTGSIALYQKMGYEISNIIMSRTVRETNLFAGLYSSLSLEQRAKLNLGKLPKAIAKLFVPHTRIFLINVGANSSHSSHARSPVFEDGRFIYVPFPTVKQTTEKRTYPSMCIPYTDNLENDLAHVDPDWENLTYGDDCKNARAVSLKKVVEGDILLFWGMLWKNMGDDWSGFTGEHDWYLLGALRVVEIVSGGKHIQDVSAKNRDRAERNIHFSKEPLSSDERIFIGDKNFSTKFAKAVNLEVKDSRGLLYRTFTSANGKPLSPNSKPNWKSSLRSCRIVFDLSVKEQYQRAKKLRKAILATNGFDLLQGIEQEMFLKVL